MVGKGVEKMTDSLPQRGLTIEGLLTLEPLSGARLVAGQENKMNVISRVNIVGSPEVLNFVRPQEFMMTTGYPFRDDVEEFSNIIPKLIEKGVAGIGIKIQRFIPEIPQRLIDRAKELQFPVVEIPPNAVFSDIVRHSMEEVFYQESEHLITLYQRVQNFTQKLAEGKEINEVIVYLEKLIGNPVVVYDFDADVIAPLLSDVLEPAEVLHTAKELQAKAGRGLSEITVRKENFQCFVISLGFDQNFAHTPFVACLESNYELTEIDCLTIEKVSTMLSMELTNTKARKKIEKRYMDQFVQDLLRGDLTSRSDFEFRRNALDLELEEKWFQVCILDSVNTNVMREEFYFLINNLSSTIKGTILGTTVQGHFALLILEDSKAALERCFEIMSREIERFFQYRKLEADYFLYIGMAVEKVDDIQDSYQRAVKVSTISQYYSYTKRLIRYDDLKIYRLLYLLPECEQVNEYIEDILGVLVENERKYSIYIETLETYFQSNRNIRVTAEKLFAHYNTIVYRLEKISSLLHVNLEDSETTLELQLALKLRKMASGTLGKQKLLQEKT